MYFLKGGQYDPDTHRVHFSSCGWHDVPQGYVVLGDDDPVCAGDLYFKLSGSEWVECHRPGHLAMYYYSAVIRKEVRVKNQVVIE